MRGMDKAASDTGSAGKLGAYTRLERVALNVRDIAAVAAFYEEGVGLTRIKDAETHVVLGSGQAAVIELIHTPELSAPPPGSAGLYHAAILFEERADLAAALYATATGFDGAFTGSADHLVSQAFYFNDPEGNGVELYWDRPREEWRWADGQVAMDSLPLDPNGFIREHGNVSATGLSAPVGAATSLGHVHLRVGDIRVAKEFYVEALGFEVTTEMWQSALFASAGGYHHHLGMNVWESRGAGVREKSLGLSHFALQISRDDHEAARARLDAAGFTYEVIGPTATDVIDPWGTKVMLR